MKKVVSVLLAVLMFCSLTLVAFAATMRFSVIDDVSASATTTRIQGTLGTQRPASLKITAQVYKYSSAADDYMRSVKFTESAKPIPKPAMCDSFHDPLCSTEKRPVNAGRALFCCRF